MWINVESTSRDIEVYVIGIVVVVVVVVEGVTGVVMGVVVVSHWRITALL